MELFLPKSVRFSRYGRFEVFGLHGHFGPIAIFFWDLEMTYLSNLGITSVMLWAVGCLTRENTQECRVVFVDFFTFSYF